MCISNYWLVLIIIVILFFILPNITIEGYSRLDSQLSSARSGNYGYFEYADLQKELGHLDYHDDHFGPYHVWNALHEYRPNRMRETLFGW
jgi:hypothetical protein